MHETMYMCDHIHDIIYACVHVVVGVIVSYEIIKLHVVGLDILRDMALLEDV